MPVIGKKFRPSIKNGLLLHLPVALLLFAGSAILFILAFQEQYGTFFILFFVVALVLLVPFIFLAYRIYALLRASYQIDRNGLQLHWGLRSEGIPAPEVEWMVPVSQLTFALPLPPLSFPGAILGTTQTAEHGPVEFMASDTDHLILVGTAKKIYAISPMQDKLFLREFQNTIELGSLAPIAPTTSLPAGYLRTVWSDKWARWLVFIGLILTLGLLTFTSLRIPSRSMVSLGYDPSGQPLPPIPAIRLLLLPSLCIFLYIIDLIGGLFFYRKPSQRSASYLLWSAAILTPLLLFIPLISI